MLRVVLVSVMLAFTATFGIVAWLSFHQPPVVETADAPPPAPPRVTVVGWAQPMQAGTLIKPENIAAINLPAEGLPPGTRLDSLQARSDLIGAMVRRNVLSQQPLLTADVLRPTDGGFLAAVLAPDHRAVSVAVDAVSGTAGLIWPGDRVDLILTQEAGEQNTPIGRRTFGETVLKDVRVIAVDQQLAHGVTPDTAVASNQSNRTVTLEVLPAAAERVAVAVRLGRVALTVRAASAVAAADPTSKDVTLVSASAPSTRPVLQVPSAPQAAAPGAKSAATTWGYDVSPALAPRLGGTASTTVRVFQGAASDKEFKFE